MRSVTAFAPATVANVAVGFDILGFAVTAVGDHVTVTQTERKGEVTIAAIEGLPDLPLRPEDNTATAGLLKMVRELNLPFGVSVSIRKGIPLGSGMGGSAASAVGAVVALNALLENPLPHEILLKYALEGELVASGSRHADNVAPCLYGGLTLSRSNESFFEVVPVPVPPSLVCVLVHPELRIDTRQARGILRPQISLKDHVHQSANLAGFIAGCYRGDTALIRRSLEDIIIEPQRASLIPGFQAVKRAALEGGALGCSISGSGPSVFALVSADKTAEKIRAAMVAAFTENGIKVNGSWVSPIRAEGASSI